jgi:hypothetical protein
MITEMVADQVAPSYWIPNKDVIVRILLMKLKYNISFRLVPRVNFILVQNILNIIVEVRL